MWRWSSGGRVVRFCGCDCDCDGCCCGCCGGEAVEGEVVGGAGSGRLWEGDGGVAGLPVRVGVELGVNVQDSSSLSSDRDGGDVVDLICMDAVGVWFVIRFVLGADVNDDADDEASHVLAMQQKTGKRQ